MTRLKETAQTERSRTHSHEPTTSNTHRGRLRNRGNPPPTGGPTVLVPRTNRVRARHSYRYDNRNNVQNRYEARLRGSLNKPFPSLSLVPVAPTPIQPNQATSRISRTRLSFHQRILLTSPIRKEWLRQYPFPEGPLGKRNNIEARPARLFR